MLAIQQPANWPRSWSTMDAEDLLSRLSRIPLYTPPGLGDTTNWTAAAEQDLAVRLGRLPLLAPAGFGDVASDVAEILQKAPELLQKAVQLINTAGPQLDTIIQVIQDPAFAQIVDRVKQLQAIDAAKSAAAPVAAAAPGTAPTPASSGLNKLVPIFDAAIFVEQHPVAQFALDHPVLVGVGAAMIVIGISAGIGIGIGRWTKRCRAPSGLRGTRKEKIADLDCNGLYRRLRENDEAWEASYYSRHGGKGAGFAKQGYFRRRKILKATIEAKGC